MWKGNKSSWLIPVFRKCLCLRIPIVSCNVLQVCLPWVLHLALLKDKTTFQKQNYYSVSLKCTFIPFFCVLLLFKCVLNLMLVVNYLMFPSISCLCSKPSSSRRIHSLAMSITQDARHCVSAREGLALSASWLWCLAGMKLHADVQGLLDFNLSFLSEGLDLKETDESPWEHWASGTVG